MSSDLTEYVGVDGAVASSAGPAASPPGFNLLEEIGRGGMGVVYRAADLSIGRDVALKVMNENRLPDPESVHRFLGEARITGQLQHPAIPAVHQVGTLPDGRPFLAMKLIKGRTLDRILNSTQAAAEDGGRLTARPASLNADLKVRATCLQLDAQTEASQSVRLRSCLPPTGEPI